MGGLVFNMGVKHVFKKTNIKVFTPTLIGILLVAGVFYFHGPIIQWTPEKFSEKIFIKGSEKTEISFVSKEDLSEVNVFVVPELSPFISVKPEHFTSIKSGEENKLELRISISQDTSPSIIEGTIQLKALKQKGKDKATKTFAKPLPVTLEIIEPTDAVNLLNDFLIEEFGTLTPPTSTVPQSVELPTEIKEAFSEGATEVVVIKSGSLVFSGLMTPNTEGKLAMFDLLNLLQEKGMVVEDLSSALKNHDLHKEGIESGGALVPIDSNAITFYPWPKALNFSDYDGNGWYETVVIVLDNDTHAVHSVEDIGKLINRDFIKEDGYLTMSASTAIHELFHVMIFRTSCFIGSAKQEEDFVSRVESLINKKVKGDDISYLLKDTLQLFPQGKDCLDRLGFVLPPTEWSLPETIYSSPEAIHYQAVTSDNSDNLHMIWMKSVWKDTWYTETYYTKRDESGWSEPVVIASSSGSFGTQPGIISDSLAHLHVAFEGRQDNITTALYMMYDGTEWSEPLNISKNVGDPWYLIRITSDNNDNLHVVWSHLSASPTVFYVKKTNETWSEPLAISPPAAGSYCGSLLPLVVSDSNNHLHVVMHTCVSVSSSVYSLFYTKFDGSAWSEPLNLNVSSSGNSGGADFALAVDKFNHPHIIASSRISGKWGMYHIYWDGSNWTTPVDISGTGNYADHARITVDKLGNIHGIWHEQITEALPEQEWQIVYSNYNGNNWSESEVIPNIPVACYPIDVIADIFNRIHVIFGYIQDATYYFSHIWK